MTDVYLYPDPANLSWDDGDCDDFKANKATQCHVLAEHLSAYQTKLNSVNVTVVGDLKPLPTTYSITLDEGTGNKDSQNWEITPKSSELGGGEDVTVKYNGSREVKSVTVVKKAAVNPNAYMKWDADQKKLVATPMPTEVTTVANANAGVNWSAGTYVVEGDVTIGGMIELKGNVDLIIKDGAKLTAKHINGFNGNSSSYNLSIYGQANQTGELVINRTDGDAIMDINTLEVHSAKVTATSSYDNCGGFSYISTFNVYGGLVDAKATGPKGYGIYLKENGSINIYGGEVKAEGKGRGVDSYGITGEVSDNEAPVTVYGGKLWAGNADDEALNYFVINLRKGDGFSGKIEYSSDNSTWSETVDADAKYVRVGY